MMYEKSSRENPPDYEHIEIIKDKSMDWLLRLSFECSKIKLLFLSVILCTLGHTILTGTTLGFFFYEFSMKFFTQYAAISAGFLYSDVVMITTLIYMWPIEKIINRFNENYRSFKNMDIKTQKNIKLTSKIINYLSLALFALSMVLVYFFLPISGANPDMYFLNWFADQYLGPFGIYFKIAHYLSFWIVFPTTVVELFPIVYVIVRIIYQTINLNYLILNISWDYDNHDLNLYYNTDFQEVIKKRLIFCIKYHQEIKTIADDFQNVVRFPLVWQSISSTILGIAIIFYVYTGMTPDTYPRMAGLSLTAIIILIMVSIVGQKLIDITGMIFDAACSSNWYLWNNTNRTTLNIFLMNCRTPHSISMSETVTLDYAFFVSTITNLYSMATVIRGFSARRNN